MESTLDTRWPKRIRAIAFDMDGLMVNTEELYTVVGETILSRRGRSFTMALKRKMMGLPGNVAWQVMIDSESLEDSPEQLNSESNVIFEDLLATRLQPMPGLHGLLDRLESAKLPFCVATSSSHRFAAKVLQLIDVRQRLEFVVTAEDVERGKPHPDIYRLAASRFNIDASEMLVLEDSENGAKAGVASGACTIAVPGEHSMDHEFTGVYTIADSLASEEICSLVDSPL